MMSLVPLAQGFTLLKEDQPDDAAVQALDAPDELACGYDVPNPASTSLLNRL